MSFAFFPSLQETYETKRKEFLGELQRKEEEMRQMFVNRVKETEAELKEKEREVGVAETCERSPEYSQHRSWAVNPGKRRRLLSRAHQLKHKHTHTFPRSEQGTRRDVFKQRHQFWCLRNQVLPALYGVWETWLLLGERRAMQDILAGAHVTVFTPGQQSKGGSCAGVPQVSAVRPWAATVTGQEINGPSSKPVRSKRAHSAPSPVAGLQAELGSSGHYPGLTFSPGVRRGVRQS